MKFHFKEPNWRRSARWVKVTLVVPCDYRLDTGHLTLTRLAQRSLALQPGNSLIGQKSTLSVGQLLSRLLLTSECHLFITIAFHLDTPLFDVDTECCAQLRHHLAENLTNASFA